MNTKNNKRRRESVEKIENALLEFLQIKELPQITVSDICKAAEINRSTFYANYEDIYDLADKIRINLEEKVGNLYKQEVENQCFSNDFLRLFNHIRENQIFYNTYFKLGYDNNYKSRLYDAYLAQTGYDNKFIDYHIEFFRNGFNAIVKKWLESGCKESPEEMYDILISEYRDRFK